MKKSAFIISCIMAFLPLCVMAQKYATQTGVARQIKYDAADKTTPVAGVRATIGTEVRSDNSGKFSVQVPLNAKRTYRITNIKAPSDKYMVVFPECDNAEYVLKSDPFLIVIADKNAVAREQQTIERRLNDSLRVTGNRLHDLYEQQKDLLDMLDEDDERYAALEDETQNLRQQLKYYYEKEQAMRDEVTRIAFRIASTDAGMLDESGQKRLQLRRNGQWGQLLSELGDSLPTDMEYLRKLIDYQQQKVAKDSAALATDTEEYLKRLSRFCRNMEERIEAFTMTFQNDSVAHCYELLTMVAPDRWQYFNDFGYFELAFRSNIDESLALMDKALALAATTNEQILTLSQMILAYDLKSDYKSVANVFDRLLPLLKSEDIDLESAMAVASTISTIMPALGDPATTFQVLDLLMPLVDQYLERTAAHAKLLLDKAHAMDVMGRYDEGLKLYQQAINIIDPTYQDTPIMPVAYYDAAICCVNMGKTALAKQYLVKADAAAKKLYGEEHQMMAKIKKAYGMIYAKSGYFVKAKETLMEALALNSALLGEEHRETAEIYNNLGYILLQQGRNEEAAEMFGKALNLFQKLLGDKHPDVAMITGNLGHAQALSGIDEGFNRLKKAISIYQEINASHPDIGRCLNDLSYAYALKGNGESALKYAQEAVSHYEKTCRTALPDMATAYNNLGFIYLRFVKYAEAEAALTMALETYDRIYGKGYIDTYKPLELLGELYSSTGDNDKALDYYSQALALVSAAMGDTHPEAMMLRLLIAGVKNDMGQVNESISDYENLIKIEEGLRPNSALLYNLNLNLGNAYIELKDYENGILYTQRAYEAAQRADALDNTNVIPYYCNMGNCLTQQGDCKSALEHLEKGLKLCDDTYQYAHEVRAIILNNMGLAYSKLGNINKAEECYRESLSVYRAVFGTDMPSMATLYTNFSNLLLKKGEITEAEDYFNRGYNLLKSQYGENSVNCYVPYYNYVTALALNGNNPDIIAHATNLHETACALYGPRSAEAAEAAIIVGSLLADTEKRQEAIPYYLNAEEIYSEVGDYNEPCWLISCSTLGTLYGSDTVNALKWFVKADEIGQKAANPDLNLLSTVYQCISGIYALSGNKESALKYADLYVDLSESLIGKQSPKIIQTYFYAAATFFSAGAIDKCIEIYERALNVSKSAFGEDHELTKSLLQTIDAIKVHKAQ